MPGRVSCDKLVACERRLHAYLYGGPPPRIFKVWIVALFVPLLLVYIFSLITSGSDAEIMKHNRGKYLEERAYSGASADVLTLPGHGFTKGANRTLFKFQYNMKQI